MRPACRNLGAGMLSPDRVQPMWMSVCIFVQVIDVSLWRLEMVLPEGVGLVRTSPAKHRRNTNTPCFTRFRTEVSAALPCLQNEIEELSLRVLAFCWRIDVWARGCV